MVDQINFLSVPYFCSIILTSKCNLRCLHCLGDYAEECPDELSLEEWKKTIDEIARLKIFYLNISGGEPTIKPYFAEFLDYLSQKGIHFMLTTNGIISNKNITAIIRNRDFLIGVKISLDGYDEESHGYIRRGLNLKPNLSFFKRTMKTIKYFNSENVPLTIASVIHSHNIVHFDRFIEVIKEINPISWFMSPIIPSGRGNFYENIKAEYNYYDSNFWNILVKKCNNVGINVRLIDLPFDIKGKSLDYYECGATLSFCEIHANGVVVPCTLCRTCISDKYIQFENLKNKSLKEIWNGPAFQQFRKYMALGCEGCKAFSKCHKCIAQSFRYFDKGNMPTPYCVRNGIKLGLNNLAAMKDYLKAEHKLIL